MMYTKHMVDIYDGYTMDIYAVATVTEQLGFLC